MHPNPLILLAALSLTTFATTVAIAQTTVPTPPQANDSAFPNRSFKLSVRDSADVDGDIIRIEVKDRTNPQNNHVIAERVRLDSTYGPALEFSLAQPVNASIVITVIQDSDNPEHRGHSGVSMTLKVEDMLEGLVWENEYEQFARTATINLNLDAVAVGPGGTPQPQWSGLTRDEYVRWLQDLVGTHEPQAQLTTEEAKALAQRVVDQAKQWEGRDTWAYEALEWPYPPGTNKCNLFVYDVLCSATTCPPKVENPKWWAPNRPPLAGEWGDRGVSVPGFQLVDGHPRPGDVIAEKAGGPGFSGHVGIVVEFDPKTGRGRTASVNSKTGKVEINDWGFRPGQGNKVVVRRPR